MKNVFLTAFFFGVLMNFSLAQTTNPSPYCNADFDDMQGFNVSDAVNSVSFGTINNVTNGQGALPHYTYFNNLTTPILLKGSTYTLNVSFEVHGGAGYGVWIDYNQNNVFENSELIAGTTTSTYLDMTMNTLVTKSVIIPTNAMTGITRMRVRIVEDDLYTSTNGGAIAA